MRLSPAQVQQYADKDCRICHGKGYMTTACQQVGRQFVTAYIICPHPRCSKKGLADAGITEKVSVMSTAV